MLEIKGQTKRNNSIAAVDDMSGQTYAPLAFGCDCLSFRFYEDVVGCS